MITIQLAIIFVTISLFTIGYQQLVLGKESIDPTLTLLSNEHSKPNNIVNVNHVSSNMISNNNNLPVLFKDIGVLVYTHGTGDHNTNQHDEKTMGIKKTLEKFGTPAEVVTHMPYDWDHGLMKLDERGVKYVIFLYTDLFGPKSTVIHNVTRGIFGGIEEYKYCPGVPINMDSCMYMGQLTKPASSVSDTTLVFAEPARPDHPYLKQIFLKQAVSAIDNPKKEILVLVGHGARSDTNDLYQKMELTTVANYVEKKLQFADSLAFTAREDWPNLSPAAIQRGIEQIKTMLEETNAEKVVLVHATGGIGINLVRDALDEENINYVEAEDHSNFGQKMFETWAIKTVTETIQFINKDKPTENTITPGWNKNYN